MSNNKLLLIQLLHGIKSLQIMKSGVIFSSSNVDTHTHTYIHVFLVVTISVGLAQLPPIATKIAHACTMSIIIINNPKCTWTV